MTNKKVFITGLFGYLGSALAKTLLAQGYNVSGIDNLSYEQDYKNIIKEINPKEVNKFTYNFCDTRDGNLLKDLINTNQPDFVVHFGDLSSVYSCNHNPSYTETVNIGGAKNVISICSDLQIPLIINSSSSVYGVQKSRHLCTEKDLLPDSTDLYCLTKLRIENLLKTESINNSKFKYIAFRPATVFGQGLRFRIELLPNHFCFSALKNNQIRVSDLNAYRAFIHLETLISAYSHIINMNFFTNQVYNIGSFNLTKLDVALSIQRYIDCKIITMPDIGDLRNLQISSSSFCIETGISLEDNFDLRIQQLIDWLTPKVNSFSSSNYNGLLNMPLNNWLSLI
jgi:nucleoside-diphosphate-sugar epimerase